MFYVSAGFLIINMYIFVRYGQFLSFAGNYFSLKIMGVRNDVAFEKSLEMRENPAWDVRLDIRLLWYPLEYS